MKIRLKKGKVESTIKTTFGGVYFLEGDEQHIDDSKILPEERIKVLNDFDILDHRGCEWAGGKKQDNGNTTAIADAKKLANSTQKEADKAAADAEKAIKKAENKNTPENIQAAEDAKKYATQTAVAAEEAAKTLADLEAVNK